MSLHIVTFTDTAVLAVVVDAADERDAVYVASRTPWKAWREVHRSVPEVHAEALDGVPDDEAKS